MSTQQCPLCGKLNDDDWPLEVKGEVKEGGCQECWEKQIDSYWWAYIQSVEFERCVKQD